MPIPCFDNFPQLKDRFLKLIKEDMPEAEQKEIGRELALEYHKELYGELEDFKKSITFIFGNDFIKSILYEFVSVLFKFPL